MLVKEGQQIIDENVQFREVIFVMVFFDFWEEKFEPALEGRDQELGSALCNLRMLAQHVEGSFEAPSELPIILVRLL